jgi:protein-S-isoprenylcysteine O-methyltransferase Ste14
MMIALRLIGVCWIVFISYWLITAWSTKKTTERASVAALLWHRALFVIGVLFFLVPARWSHLSSLDVPHSLITDLNTLVVPHSPVTEGIAVCVCILGVMGAIWARRTLAGNWSSEVVFKENHELVERGPYQWVRHPIYTSILLMVLGAVLAAGRLASFVGLLFMASGLWIKLRQEEALMLRHFPAQYAAYMSRVKALIPFVL